MIYAVVLAAGTGSRMNSSVKKQYMELQDKPIICHTLDKFQKSRVDKIVLVTGDEELEYCADLVEQYRFSKVENVITGGKERYNSVKNALDFICEEVYFEECEQGNTGDKNIVLIHDGARPLVSTELINRCVDSMKDNEAVIVGVPVKDTIKIINSHGQVESTPDRSTLWSVQTPQTFELGLISSCYRMIDYRVDEGIVPTDDAMVVEMCSNHTINIIEGEYTNIKITTPDDILTAENFLKKS